MWFDTKGQRFLWAAKQYIVCILNKEVGPFPIIFFFGGPDHMRSNKEGPAWKIKATMWLSHKEQA